MLEYVFFEEEPRQRFQTFLDQKGLTWTLQSGDPETLVVLDDSAVDDALADHIESLYDELFAMEQAIYEASVCESAEHYTGTGVVVNLSDGRSVYADLAPDLLNRILSVITPVELGTMVDAIVSAVENPDERTYCQRIREDG